MFHPFRLPLLPFTAVLLALLVIAIYQSTPGDLASETPVSWLDYWLHKYQTLVAGALAFLGGVSAYFAVKRRITHDRNVETERRFQRQKAIASATGGAFTAVIRDLRLLLEILEEMPPDQPVNANRAAKLRTVAQQSVVTLQGYIDPTTVAELGHPVGYTVSVLLGEISFALIGWQIENYFEANNADKITKMLKSLLFHLTIVRNLLVKIAATPQFIDTSDLQQVRIGWSQVARHAERYHETQDDLGYLRDLVDLNK